MNYRNIVVVSEVVKVAHVGYALIPLWRWNVLGKPFLARPGHSYLY